MFDSPHEIRCGTNKGCTTGSWLTGEASQPVGNRASVDIRIWFTVCREKRGGGHQSGVYRGGAAPAHGRPLLQPASGSLPFPLRSQRMRRRRVRLRR